MNPALPPPLSAALDALLTGVSRKDLAARTQATSTLYRTGKGSASAITSEHDALAYLVARLPATYAVAAACLAQLQAAVPDFHPASLLDVGAGPGTASWAALETWPDLNQILLTDSNPHFLALARRLATDHAPLSQAQFLASDLGHATALPSADLVIASFVLAEIAPAAQRQTLDKLFAAAADVLLLIEPGTPPGFERLRAARTALIEQGANILAPCTHASTCPMIAPDWCHFSQRLPRRRAHMQAKDASVPYEDERYAWLAVGRTRRAALEGKARVLAPPLESKPGRTFKLCTPDGLESRFIARRDREAFVALRRADWSDVVVL